jgi:hypothetical protein
LGDGHVLKGVVSVFHVGDRVQHGILVVVDRLANKLVDLTENGLFSCDSALMFAGEDMFVIVFKLLTTDCAEYLVRAGLRLFEAHWALFVWQ